MRMVITLLETCGHYFDRGSSKRKLDRFLVHFQRYVLSKGALPLDIEFDLQVSKCSSFLIFLSSSVFNVGCKLGLLCIFIYNSSTISSSLRNRILFLFFLIRNSIYHLLSSYIREISCTKHSFSGLICGFTPQYVKIFIH